MVKYRYELEPYKGANTRYHCPNCKQKDKSFVRYVDIITGEYLHTSVGKCNHADSCKYHYTPVQYFKDNNISFDNKKEYIPIQKETPKPSYIDAERFKASLKGYEDNRLIQYLIKTVGVEATSKAIEKYYIGTSKYWDGSSVFWQIDGSGRIHAGKIMQYDNQSGKRIKEPVNKIQWVHTVLKLDGFNLKQCFFGEHLLRDITKMVAIVESEKTAVIASVYLPDLIWLSCGGSEGLNIDKCAVLKGRKVILFPDCGQFEKWNTKAKELSKICSLSVSSFIEKNATDKERKSGFDLADYLVRFSPSEFATQKNPTSPVIQQAETAIQQKKDTTPYYAAYHKRNDWSSEIRDFETWLAETTLPTKPFRLSVCETINDVQLFIEGHLLTAKANNGNPTFRPHLDRLINFKNKLTI